MGNLNDEPLDLVDGAIVFDRETFEETGSKTYFRVVIEPDDFLSYPDTTSVKVVDTNDKEFYKDLDTLTLVTQELNELDLHDMPDFSISEEELNDLSDNLEKLFVKAFVEYEDAEISDKLYLRIETEGYNGAKGLTIQHKAHIGYDQDWVVSDDLITSVRIAIKRFKEDNDLKPQELLFYDKK